MVFRRELRLRPDDELKAKNKAKARAERRGISVLFPGVADELNYHRASRDRRVIAGGLL
jgi:hypothetical protein